MLAASPAQAKSLKWMDGPPGLPSGSKFAVVSGDPSKEGTFTIRAKFPGNYAVPAHHHPTDERVTVLSGRLAYGMSDKLDKAKGKPLKAGQHVVMKAGMNHWVYARGVPSEVQITAKGPFQITYVDPKDDPRTK
jgi:mannose-6-phosphate isomerase-like protein (cupin superfamily)